MQSSPFSLSAMKFRSGPGGVKKRGPKPSDQGKPRVGETQNNASQTQTLGSEVESTGLIAQGPEQASNAIPIKKKLKEDIIEVRLII
jgi:hypothetical protein